MDHRLESESPAPRGNVETGLETASLLGSDDTRISTTSANARQAAIANLYREFAAEALRIASVKAGQAADDLLIRDDGSAERQIKVAIAHLREGADAFRKMETALARLDSARQ